MTRVAVTGSSGLIGSALIRSLTADGHQVVRMVRRPSTGPGEVAWDPSAGTVDLDALSGVEAVVHLAGVGVGDRRWTPEYKQQIRDSRVLGTRTLVDALTRLVPRPRVLVSASAQGFYGDRGDEVLTEASAAGTGFLAEVVRDWEAAAQPAAAAGIRTVMLRTGLVMAPSGGAFGQLLPLIKLGLGGPLGNGREWWSWITLEDEVAAIRFALDHDISGPVNLGAPEPARNAQVIRAIARAFHRPAVVPAPAFALRIVVGEFAEDILASVRMLPQQLLAAGFRFAHPDLDGAARWLAGR